MNNTYSVFMSEGNEGKVKILECMLGELSDPHGDDECKLTAYNFSRAARMSAFGELSEADRTAYETAEREIKRTIDYIKDTTTGDLTGKSVSQVHHAARFSKGRLVCDDLLVAAL